MATQDGRASGRPYRKASEYRAQRQVINDASSRTMQSLESENELLRERLASAERKLETMEVEYDQSREYFVEQLELTKLRLREKMDSLTIMQRNYSELQAVLYELQEKNSKVFEIERDRDQLLLASRQSDERIVELTNTIRKLKEDNEKLRHECKLAVSLLQCNQGDVKPQPTGQSNVRQGNYTHNHNQVRVDLSQYNEHVNPYMDDSDDDDSAYQDTSYGYNRPASDRKFGRPPGPVAKDPPKSAPASRQFSERKSPIFKKMPKSPESTEPERTATSTNNQSKPVHSSPWERQDSTNTGSLVSRSSQGSTPWVRDPTQIQDHKPLQFNQIGYRYSSAEIYGATPIVYAKPKPIAPKLEEKPIMTGNVRIPEKRFIPARPSNKGTGENKDVYIAEDESTNMTHDSPFQHINSSDSSRKSTPNKVLIAAERGSSAEKSSLLMIDDDDDVVMTLEQDTGTRFRMKSAYKSRSSEVEGRGLLGRESDPEQEERIVMRKETVQYVADSDEDEEGTNERNEERPNTRDGIMRKEAVMHEEMNLMTMNEVIAPTPQQKDSALNDLLLTDTDVISHAMLADIPPPNMDVIATDTILGAPPPPPMFMGNLPATAPHPPPYNHPMPYSSSAARFYQPFMMPQSSMISQPYSMMSQPAKMSRPMMSQPPPMQQKQEVIVTSPTNALDNLTSVVQKEFESAQSPKKSAGLTQDTEDNITVDTPPSGDDIAIPPSGVVESKKETSEALTQSSDKITTSEPSDMQPSTLHAGHTTESAEDTLVEDSLASPVQNSLGKEQNIEITNEDGGNEPADEVLEVEEILDLSNSDGQSPVPPAASPELLV